MAADVGGREVQGDENTQDTSKSVTKKKKKPPWTKIAAFLLKLNVVGANAGSSANTLTAFLEISFPT